MRMAQPWSPNRASAPLLSAQGGPAEAEVVPAPQPGPVQDPALLSTVPFDPMAPLGEGYGPGYPQATAAGCGGGAMCDGSDACESNGGYCEPCRGGCLEAILARSALFVGVQGFQGPADLGTNGNFGFHEGINIGAPLGDPWGLGYQVGLEAVHSDFWGTENTNDGNSRDQWFATVGLFKRAVCGGLQGGAVFDYMHDNYYDRSDLKRIRSETSLVFDGLHEIGYWGAYGLGNDRLSLSGGRFEYLKPNDIFSMFYRRHFTGGGQGRFWGGLTGMGQGVIGADASVPLGTNWALEQNFVFLIPENGGMTGARQEESWAVSLQLVWYPGRSSRCVFQDPYHPVFNVSDNSTFLVRRAARTTTPQ